MMLRENLSSYMLREDKRNFYKKQGDAYSVSLWEIYRYKKSIVDIPVHDAGSLTSLVGRPLTSVVGMVGIYKKGEKIVVRII